MEVYNSEQDQVEALKAWWDKHGKLVIVGVLVLLAGVYGWKNWQDRQVSRADAASVAYFQMMETASVDPDAAMEIGRHIIGEFTSTTYAPMASLMLARLAMERQDLVSAEAYLRTVTQQRDVPELRSVATLRLAQLLFAQQRDEEALAELQGEAGSLQPLYEELRGDILLSQGQREQAREAYTSAVSGLTEQPERRMLVEMKLNDLAESSNE